MRGIVPAAPVGERLVLCVGVILILEKGETGATDFLLRGGEVSTGLTRGLRIP